mgnify:CR=1 FL=1
MKDRIEINNRNMSTLQDRMDLLLKEVESLKNDIKLEQEPILCSNPAMLFEVMTEDLGKMNWDAAMKACADLGDGWRLPTRLELLIMYDNKDEIGGFANSYYWSSTEDDYDDAWTQYFSNGFQYYLTKNATNYVRAVRDIKK